jgi:hypothetical protein
MTSVSLSLDWLPSSHTAITIEQCGRAGQNPFVDIPAGVTYVAPLATTFPVVTRWGDFSENPGFCYYYYKDTSISGSTSFNDQLGFPPIVVEHGLEMLIINGPDPTNGSRGFAQMRVRFATRIICNSGNSRGSAAQPYADGFEFSRAGIATNCGTFSSAIGNGNNYRSADAVFVLSGAQGLGFYQWFYRGTLSGNTNPLP